MPQPFGRASAGIFPKPVYNGEMIQVAIAATRSPEQTISQWLARRWFMVFALGFGTWVLLPWLAPLFMQAGWAGGARTVYFIYSLFCHQLPERSFFLFGPEAMYSLAQIQDAGASSLNPMVLRTFVGNAEMGWKVAWSDRMVSFYTAVWAFAIVWWFVKRRLKPLPWWGFVLLLVPMAVDGLTHTVSDFSGLGLGFRDTNTWLAALGFVPASIVRGGDALGSFNSYARLITGVLAGIGIVWFAFPHMERSFAQT